MHIDTFDGMVWVDQCLRHEHKIDTSSVDVIYSVRCAFYVCVVARVTSTATVSSTREPEFNVFKFLASQLCEIINILHQNVRLGIYHSSNKGFYTFAEPRVSVPWSICRSTKPMAVANSFQSKSAFVRWLLASERERPYIWASSFAILPCAVSFYFECFSSI